MSSELPARVPSADPSDPSADTSAEDSADPSSEAWSDPALAAVRETLAARRLHDRIRLFDVDLPTAASAAEALGCEVGAIANSLVFRAGDEPVLVMASGAHRVDPVKAGALFGVDRLRRADAATVRAATGQEVGGCAPAGHPAPLRTVVDVDLAGHERLWAGGGVKHAMLWLTYDELLALTGGTPAVVA